MPLTKITKIDQADILPFSMVTVTRMNHLTEVQYMARMNSTNHIRKLDKDRYVDLSDGEIKEYMHTENRKESFNSLRQTFKRLRYLINYNFIGAKNELHVTLTYKENMTDTERLYRDFDNFRKRLRYAFRDKSTFDYLVIVEPQGRGAWHCHLLVRFNDVESIYIDNEQMRKLWGHGYVTVKNLKDVDNIGAYLSAYLTDVELTDENEIESIGQLVKVTPDGKKFIKGGRLHFYPPGMNLYRRSKGIRDPERVRMKYSQIKNVVGSFKPNYVRTYFIDDQENKFTNEIVFESYNLKRTRVVEGSCTDNNTNY